MSDNGSTPDLSVLKQQPIRAWPWPRILVFIPMFPALPYASEVFYDFLRIAVQGPAFLEGGHTRVDLARELAVRRFVESDFTHLLMLDADHKHPARIIQRLARWVIMKPEIKIVGGLNFRRGEPYDPCAYVLGEDNTYYAPREWEKGLLEVDRIGTGSLMVHRDVFEAIREPWFYHDGSGEFSDGWFSEDIVFCKKAKDAGFRIFCDTSTISPHLISGFVDDNTYKVFIEEHPEEYGEVVTL